MQIYDCFPPLITVKSTLSTLRLRLAEGEAEVATTTAALKRREDEMEATLALKNRAIADLVTEVERRQKDFQGAEDRIKIDTREREELRKELAEARADETRTRADAEQTRNELNLKIGELRLEKGNLERKMAETRAEADRQRASLKELQNTEKNAESKSGEN